MGSGMCKMAEWDNVLLVKAFVTLQAHALWWIEHEKVSSVLAVAGSHICLMEELNAFVAHCSPWRMAHVNFVMEELKSMPTVPPHMVVP